MRTELVSTEALAEAFTKQSWDWLVKYYSVEREERFRVKTKYPVLEHYWWQCVDSVLRLEQLHAHKGDSQTPSPNTKLVVRHC